MDLGKILSVMNDIRSQIERDLKVANRQLLREAIALRQKMEMLIERLESGGKANVLDTLGSLSSNFDAKVTTAATLLDTLHLFPEEEAK